MNELITNEPSAKRTIPAGAEAPNKSLSLTEEVNTLRQVSVITIFLQNAVSDSVNGDSCEWSSPQALGFSILLQDLVGRIEKAADIVDEYMTEGARHG